VAEESKVLIYELARGKLVSELKSEVSCVSHHLFGETGIEYIVVDSTKSLVSLFKLDDKISTLIRKVQAQMVQNPLFWRDYPINMNAGAPLSKEEKEQMKKQRIEREGDPHEYHPFLEQSIVKARNLNSQLTQTGERFYVDRSA
jgi:hypothetical protein